MARILYGVHGTGHGHAMRGLTLGRALPQHDFLFVANDDALKVLEPEFRVARLPNLGTVFKNYRVDLGATVGRAIPILLHGGKYLKQLMRAIEDFKPDVCLADLEYFVPRAAKKAGIPCLTLDHQHIITCRKHDLPEDMRWDAFLQGLTPRYLFRPTEANLIISFYNPPPLPQYNALVTPPILREKVLRAFPRDDGHILAYQSNSTDKRLIKFLRLSRRTVHLFGYLEEEKTEGNIIFHKRDEDRFVDLLAGCAYVIQGGGHTLMGEALHLGKPILALPLKAMVEQRFNAFYLEKLGYGRQADMSMLDNAFLQDFEANLDGFKANMEGKNFVGNARVFSIVDQFAKSRQIPVWN